MAHNEASRARAYDKMRARRSEWLRTNGPCRHCGSTVDLEVDHIDRSQKVTHTVWSWKIERMNTELAKCQVLCHDCHKRKSAEENRAALYGTPNLRDRILTPANVRRIVRQNLKGRTERWIASKWGIGKTTVHSILGGISYKEINRV